MGELKTVFKKLIDKKIITVIKNLDRKSWLMIVDLDWNKWNKEEISDEKYIDKYFEDQDELDTYRRIKRFDKSE